MSVTLGSGWAPRPQPDPAPDMLERVLMAVQALQATFAQIPAPVVHVEPADLTAIVTAVQGLGGSAGPSAEEIAQALKAALGVPTTPEPVDLSVLSDVVKALEKLDFRMKGGNGGTAGVGGTVATIGNDVAVKPAAGTTAFPVTVVSGVANNSLTVDEALNVSAVSLNSTPYSGTLTVSNDFFLSTIHLTFTTARARTITISSDSGRVLYAETASTDTDLLLDFEQEPFDSSEVITVAVGATSGACALSVIAVVTQGSGMLAGNPVLGAGTAHVGSVNVDNFGFVLDPNNSTTTPLLAGQHFVGVGTDLSQYAAVTYGLYADPDQMATAPVLTFEFSDDNINWDTQVPATVYSGHVFIPVPLRPVKRYFRLDFANGSADQTTFRLSTYLHRTVPQDLARTGGQTLQANDATEVVRALIEPSFKGSISILGADRSIGHEGVVVPYIPIDLAQFDVPFANNSITPTQTGTGATAQSATFGAKLTVTGAGVGKANLRASKKINYIPGRESRQEFSAYFPASCPVGGNAVVGASDQPQTPLSGSANSLLLGYVGTVFGFHVVSGGTVTTIPKTAWNGDLFDGSGLSEFRSGLDPIPGDITKGNAWRIRWVYYGIGPVYLEWKSPDDVWVVAHSFRYPNTAIVPYIQSPNLYMCWDLTTTGSPAALTMGSFSSNAGVCAPEVLFEPHEIGGHIQVQQALAAQTTSGNTTLYTVPSGRQLFVKTLWLNLLTVSQNALNAIQITDGAGGTLLFATQGSTNNGSQVNQSVSFEVPLVFTSAVVANLIIGGGSMKYDCGFTGYHKEA